MIEKRLRQFRRPHFGSVRIDETYVKIRGTWPPQTTLCFPPTTAISSFSPDSASPTSRPRNLSMKTTQAQPAELGKQGDEPFHFGVDAQIDNDWSLKGRHRRQRSPGWLRLG